MAQLSAAGRLREAPGKRVRRWMIVAAAALLFLVVALTFAPLTPPADRDPSWSPDGTRIVFASERDGNSEIYVMFADGTRTTRLTHDRASDGYPIFSPDGTKISFDSDRDGNFELYVMNADGSSPRRLTQDPARDVSASWAPDGSKITFMSDRSGQFEIWVMDADGSNLKRMTDFGSNWFPRWSPDGTKIAYHVGRDIHVLKVKESRFERLTIDPDNGMYPDWSPGGRQLAFMSWRAGPTEIFVMDADGTNQQRLTETVKGQLIDPRWSPNGKQIAFVHLPQGPQLGGPKVIYVMNADGTGVSRLSKWWLSFDTLRYLFAPPFRIVSSAIRKV